jgi:hypothetical protein
VKQVSGKRNGRKKGKKRKRCVDARGDQEKQKGKTVRTRMLVRATAVFAKLEFL